MRSPYSLFSRPNSKGKRVYYVRFWLETERTYATPKSTGQTSKAAAKLWADNYLKKGQVVTSERRSFKGFATNFYALDGQFATAMRLKGKPFTDSMLKGHQAHLNKHAIPFFGAKYLNTIDVEMMDQFCAHLMAKGLAGSTVKHVQQSVIIMFKWAVRLHLMQTVPISDNVAGPVRDRGTLGPEEVRALFALPGWPLVHKVINLIAYSTGMRQGEILALRRKAIHFDKGYIDVDVSWSRITNSLKSTKTKKSRFIPVPSVVMEQLQVVMAQNETHAPDDLIFTATNPLFPIDRKLVERVLYRMLEQIGIDARIRVERNIRSSSR